MSSNSTFPVDGTAYTIKHVKSDKYVKPVKDLDNVHLVAEDVSGTAPDEVKWLFTKISDGCYTIKNKSYTKGLFANCLQEDPKTRSRDIVACTQDPSCYFTLEASGNNYVIYMLASDKSTKTHFWQLSIDAVAGKNVTCASASSAVTSFDQKESTIGDVKVRTDVTVTTTIVKIDNASASSVKTVSFTDLGLWAVSP